jgi:predicted DNA-binding transcriptional regulator AlpA
MSPLQINKDLLTPREVAGRMSIGMRTLWRMVELKRFPQPVRFTRKLVRWKARDVEAYINKLRSRRRAS